MGLAEVTGAHGFLGPLDMLARQGGKRLVVLLVGGCGPQGWAQSFF